jgi:hypothetical protein
MSLFTRFPVLRFLVFGSAIACTFSSKLSAQSAWKPSEGDWFECQITEANNCGDYECYGMDTVLFEIVDTSFNADAQHPNTVLAATSAIGLHLYYSTWGNGWNSTEVSDSYGDTTLLTSTGSQEIETSFNGYNADRRNWTQIPFVRDTSVIFQGISYEGSLAISPGAIFLPTLGWFFSLSGYEYIPACGTCGSGVLWMLGLISASTAHASVQSESNTNSLLLSNGSTLQLINFEADKITLMDLLGRIVNVWLFPVSGPRDITLNDADVPSGVYFLRVSAPGVDEMRKVVIVH